MDSGKESNVTVAQMTINLMMHVKESGMVIATTSLIIRTALSVIMGWTINMAMVSEIGTSPSKMIMNRILQ